MLVQIALRDAAAVEWPRPLMATRVGSSAMLGPAQAADHVPSRSTEFLWPLRRRLLRRPVAAAAPGQASSSDKQPTHLVVVVGDEIARLAIAANRGLLSETSRASSGLARSSQGLPLATQPHVAVLVVPSVRVRRRANRRTRQGLTRAPRQSRGWACWPPSRWIARRCGSIRPKLQGQARTVRDRRDTAAVARPHLHCASLRWAGWRPLRCHRQGMKATAQARKRPARRYQDVELAGLALIEEPPSRRASLPVW